MNIILNPDQSNTRSGEITVLAHDDLSARQSFFSKLGNDGGVTKAYKIAAVTDSAVFLIDSGDIAGNEVSLEVPNTGENFRVRAKGTGNGGDVLVFADPSTDADAGKVRSFTGSVAPVTAGEYFSPGIAEEAFVDGQLVKARYLPRKVRITSAFVPTGVEATDFAALKVVLQAQGIVT